MSRHEPQFENEARTSELVLAPTVTARAVDAGEYEQASALLLPAAMENEIPSEIARSTAVFNDRL